MEHAFGNVVAIVGNNKSRAQERDERWSSRLGSLQNEFLGLRCSRYGIGEEKWKSGCWEIEHVKGGRAV